MLRPFRLACVLTLAALLAACGGGGDDSGGSDGGFEPDPGTTFDALAAWSNFLLTSRRWEVSGIGSDGVLYRITVINAGATGGGGGTLQPILGFPVPNFTAATSETTLITAAAGTITSVFRRTFFDPGTLRILGLASQEDGGFPACDVALSAAVPTRAANVGDGGTLAVLDERSDCSFTGTSRGRLDVTWSVQREAGIPFFCIDTVEIDNATGLVASRESDCVEVTPEGALGTRARVTLQIDGFTLVAG